VDQRVLPVAKMFANVGRVFRSIGNIFHRDADQGPPNPAPAPAPPSRLPSQESEDEEKSRPVALSNVKEHCRKLSESSNYAYNEEFLELKQVGQRQESTAGELTRNRGKNRYYNISTYDHSRVKLVAADDPDETEGGDYINANFIPGFHSKREFIATQGPLHSTQYDFWRMIWETNAVAIVMLTNLVERGQDKCSQYWPPDSLPLVYGEVKVQVLKETEDENWTLRQLAVKKADEEEGEKRVLPHLHLTTWPDRGVPDTPDTLNGFVRLFREQINPGEEPIVVHCSAGVGRTGTFIAVDRLCQDLICNPELDHEVDILGMVAEMRMHRMKMVQKENQYKFIHQCLLLALEEFGINEEDAFGVQRAPQGAERVARRRRRRGEEEEGGNLNQIEEEEGEEEEEGGDKGDLQPLLLEEDESADEDEGVGDLEEVVDQAVE